MTTVHWIMQRDLVCVSGQESVAGAVARLAGKNVGALLVVADGRVKGILSERDVLRRVIAKGRDPQETRVGEVATPKPTAVSEHASIKECTRLIRRHGFRHLPIVDEEERPLGIISARDLLQFVLEGLEAYIERHALEQHREEMVDPYEALAADAEA